MYMELVVKATNTERTTFSFPHECTTTFATASNGSSHIASNHFFSRGLLSRRLLATLFRRRLRCRYVCMYACMTNATAVRRLFLVASRPMLIPFKHRHLVTFLQCQFLQCSSAKPLRQTNVKACQLQLSRNKSRRVCGRFQLVKYEDSRSLP